MCPNQTQQNSPSNCEKYQTEKSELHSKFKKEQKKLEDMVMTRLARGKANLGTDVIILKQSSLIDQLIVDKIRLEELYKRHVVKNRAKQVK